MEYYMGYCRILIGCLVVGMTGIFSGTALAETERLHPIMDARFGLWLGGFFPNIDTKISIDGEVIENPPILSMEEIFGLEDSKSVFWGGASWRISNRNTIEFEFNNLNRSAITELVTDEPIEIGDSIADAGVKVDSTFDLTLARLTYGYSVMRSDKMEVKLKAGLHIADIAATLKLGAGVRVCQPGEVPPDCSVYTGSTDRLESSDVTLPLPHFGASFAYAITPKVAIRTQAIGFALKINDIKGSIFEIDADVVYHPWRRVGLGAGVRYFNANIESTGSHLKGEFDFEYFGPVIYGKLTF
jgi:hypothetical protein